MPWKTLEVAIGLALVIAGSIVLVIISRILGANPDSGLALVVVVGIVGIILVMSSWVIGPARYGISPASLGMRLPSPMGYHQPLLPFLALGGSLLFSLIYVTAASALGWGTPDPPFENTDLSSPWVTVGLAFVVVLWGPLAEEIFFRGFIFQGLIGRLGVLGAAIAGSLLFAVFHLDVKVMVPIFVTGLLLTWLYHKTGSVWSSWAAHALQNAVAFSVTVWG